MEQRWGLAWGPPDLSSLRAFRNPRPLGENARSPDPITWGAWGALRIRIGFLGPFVLYYTHKIGTHQKIVLAITWAPRFSQF